MRPRARTVVVPSEGLIRLSTVLAMFPVNRWEWSRGVKAGRYPAPVRLGPRVWAWKVDEIRALIHQCDPPGRVDATPRAHDLENA